MNDQIMRTLPRTCFNDTPHVSTAHTFLHKVHSVQPSK